MNKNMLVFLFSVVSVGLANAEEINEGNHQWQVIRNPTDKEFFKIVEKVAELFRNTKIEGYDKMDCAKKIIETKQFRDLITEKGYTPVRVEEKLMPGKNTVEYMLVLKDKDGVTIAIAREAPRLEKK